MDKISLLMVSLALDLETKLTVVHQVEASFVKEFCRCSNQQFRIYRNPGDDITNSNIMMTSLWGKSRVSVLKNIRIGKIALGPISDNGCSESQIEYWQDVFEDLNSVYQEISLPEPVQPDRIDVIQGNVSNRIARIRELIGPELITPYMHVMEAHVADMIRATPFLSMGAFSWKSF